MPRVSRTPWVVAAVIVGTVVWSSTGQATPQDSTATVERGPLSALVSQAGTLTYRGSYTAINQARGVYTQLPAIGDKVRCGGVLYRVDDQPVKLLCGATPAYRTLRRGDTGRDVRQLNRALHLRGKRFTTRTAKALGRTQLPLGAVVFLPEPVRVAKVAVALGAGAQPGTPALTATSDELQVQVNLDPSQQGEVKRGDSVEVTLPGNTPVAGKVAAFGTVAQAPDTPDSKPTDATISTYIRLDDPAATRGLDQAPVQVDITTKGVDDALSVPVTALVGKAGDAFAVEVVRPGGRRELVAVVLGLFDTGGGRVQVTGPLRAGDRVVVPAL